MTLDAACILSFLDSVSFLMVDGEIGAAAVLVILHILIVFRNQLSTTYLCKLCSRE